MMTREQLIVTLHGVRCEVTGVMNAIDDAGAGAQFGCGLDGRDITKAYQCAERAEKQLYDIMSKLGAE